MMKKKTNNADEPAKIDFDILKTCVPNIPKIEESELTPVERELLNLYRNSPDLKEVADSFKKLFLGK